MTNRSLARRAFSFATKAGVVRWLFERRTLLFFFVAIVAATTGALNAQEAGGGTSELATRLAAIQREAVLIEKVRVAWSSGTTPVSTRATFEIARATRLPSFGSLTSVEGLTGYTPEVALEVQSKSEWTFHGLAKPITFAGNTQPENLPDALEQRAARQEFLYQKHRRAAFDPPLRPLWQQPFQATLDGNILTQVWGSREDAYPRVIVSEFAPEQLEIALAAPELMLAEALLLSAAPSQLPLIPVQLGRCKLKSDQIPFNDGVCIALTETLSAASGFTRRQLWLRPSDYAVIRAIYVPLDRSPEPRKRQPSEYAAEGDAAVLDIPGERPATVVIDLNYHESDSKTAFADSITVSWVNHYGGVAEFWELSKIDEQGLESGIQSPAEHHYADGTWILNTTSNVHSLVTDNGIRDFTSDEMDEIHEYSDMFPKSRVKKFIDVVLDTAISNPRTSLALFWITLIGILAGKRYLSKTRAVALSSIEKQAEK